MTTVLKPLALRTAVATGRTSLTITFKTESPGAVRQLVMLVRQEKLVLAEGSPLLAKLQAIVSHGWNGQGRTFKVRPGVNFDAYAVHRALGGAVEELTAYLL